MKKTIQFLLALTLTFATVFADENGDEKKDKDPMSAGTFSGLKTRLIGPALTSGRIIDFAVNEENPAEFYVAVACGGVWKSTNFGATFKPVFDGQKSYSIGCVTIDPNNPHCVWVGTGENNSQRSVAWGDGVYKSLDGGKSWKNMGLKQSEHIGKILIDPRNSDVVYVAAQGPLWGPGGDRGLYKSTDGGETWKLSLEISENTGVSDIAFDPRIPDHIYASSYQRRRAIWTLINGGPESAVYKTTDAGKNWTKLKNGLPDGELGRIGLAVSPANPDIVYALIEAYGDKGGFFRSTDRGASWEKRDNYKTSSAQYYQEIFCDPINPDLVYSVETYSKYTEDGGKTWKRLPLPERHVDDHALWIDPDNTDHLLIGGDGGVYRSFDRGENWRFYENLPVTQFYRIQADNSYPFYYVYGGTQDNNTFGGPSQTVNASGITNCDWFQVVGGDGYEPQIDPVDPNIVYGQAQYGWLVRFDRKSGEMTGIQPQPEKGEEIRWNWDTPLIISPHSHTRLYFAANKVFRSDDRGDTWKKISGDLTRQIDRNELEIMGKVWSPETVAKNASTSLYGNIVSLVESPKKENLIYVGTDDGLIQVSEDAQNWLKYDKFPGVPKLAYVSDVFASRHDENVVYAAFNNHKRADFKPYLLKSTDKGKTWKSIVSNLPEDEPVWTIEEDPIDKNILFVGTELSLYFTLDGGDKWIKAKGGLPPIAVRDLDVQERESDLVIGTFGRGVYIFDDYAPLRETNKETLDKEAHIFKIKDALMYHLDRSKGRNSLGSTFYRADNPDFGATVTYYLKEAYKTRKDVRKENEKEIRKDAKKSYEYPTFEELRAEDLEESPYLVFVFSDDEGNVIRRLTAPNKPGINRITWDLRFPDMSPLSKNTKVNKHSGMPVMPGKYQVSMFKSVDGNLTKIAGPVEFNAKLLKNRTLPARDRKELTDFRKKMMKLTGAVYATQKYLDQLEERTDIIRKTLMATPGATVEMKADARRIELELAEFDKELNGDKSISARNANQTPWITDRLGRALYGMWFTDSEITQTNREVYNIVSEQMKTLTRKMRELAEKDLAAIERKLDELDAPWTPGRVPVWDGE